MTGRLFITRFLYFGHFDLCNFIKGKLSLEKYNLDFFPFHFRLLTAFQTKQTNNECKLREGVKMREREKELMFKNVLIIEMNNHTVAFLLLFLISHILR